MTNDIKMMSLYQYHYLEERFGTNHSTLLWRQCIHIWKVGSLI